jgi:hypothetical protein
MPPLEEVSGDSEEEQKGDRSEGKVDWETTKEEGVNFGESSVDSEGSGGETWELFSLSGVRQDSV